MLLSTVAKIMKLIDLDEAKILDNFTQSIAGQFLASGSELLQSWVWGDFLRSGGAEIKRLGLVDDRLGGRELLAVLTLIKKPILGPYFYWYAPRGPLFLSEAIQRSSATSLKELAKYLLSAVKQLDNRAVFFRLEPNFNIFTGLNLVKTTNLEPAQTLILDLEQSSEKLLAVMHPKTRYNLRLAVKKGVKIVAGQPDDFSEFWRLLNLTGERDAFRLHQPQHYRNLLAQPGNYIKLVFAEYEGKKIAAGLFSSWGNKVTYLHGASDNAYRQLMAPYLLQWSQITRAQDQGYRYYDFYGIDVVKWPGVTRFKLGFGGQVVDYPGTFDAIFQPKLYKLYTSLRQWRRRLGQRTK
jgi:lipid II:glycine glycyltransferase (peptidoglycan interpeptide bridge formation enzyme)